MSTTRPRSTRPLVASAAAVIGMLAALLLPATPAQAATRSGECSVSAFGRQMDLRAHAVYSPRYRLTGYATAEPGYAFGGTVAPRITAAVVRPNGHVVHRFRTGRTDLSLSTRRALRSDEVIRVRSVWTFWFLGAPLTSKACTVVLRGVTARR